MNLLQVQNLSKAFGGVKAVQQVSFDLQAGELLALIGPNGAGKSTTFNMVGGQLPPDSGQVLLNGQPITGLPPRRLARLGAWEDAPEQGIVYWSDVCYEIHGLPKGAPLPRNYIDTYVAPPWREAMRAKFLECIRHGIDWNIVMQVVRADGEWVWVRARGEPVVENGRLARVRGVMQDIDEAKRAEEQLRQSEEHFARIFQLVDQPMGMVRRSDGRYQIVNPAWEALTGITQDEALGRTAPELDLLTPEAEANMRAATAASGQLSDYEITLTVRDGTRRTVLQSLREVDYYGEPCWLFSAHDITERKRNEERVREREELLSLTVSAASLGLWDWDLHKIGRAHV